MGACHAPGGILRERRKNAEKNFSAKLQFAVTWARPNTHATIEFFYLSSQTS
jgi:hypothetical protein